MWVKLCKSKFLVCTQSRIESLKMSGYCSSSYIMIEYIECQEPRKGQQRNAPGAARCVSVSLFDPLLTLHSESARLAGFCIYIELVKQSIRSRLGHRIVVAYTRYTVRKPLHLFIGYQLSELPAVALLNHSV